jgi:endonuclease/exonuclease/phosphatase (EEP) superfamily protein YafD
MISGFMSSFSLFYFYILVQCCNRMVILQRWLVAYQSRAISIFVLVVALKLPVVAELKLLVVAVLKLLAVAALKLLQVAEWLPVVKQRQAKARAVVSVARHQAL